MKHGNPDVIIVGAGIFGATAALELSSRGHSVSIVDQNPLPHPLAATTDISKVVRMEYGVDAQYMAMVEEALVGFRSWNDRFQKELYHETGVTMFTRFPMAPGGFEFESYQMLLARGHRPERLDPVVISSRFPAWKKGEYVDGFFHAEGGYAESGQVLQEVLSLAMSQGVRRVDDRVLHLESDQVRVTGVRTMKNERYTANHTVVAAGAWTHVVVSGLSKVMKATGHPVFHLIPPNPSLFEPPFFGTFTADVARSGWYGFPVHPTEGVVKIANHGVGVELHPDNDERIVTSADEAHLRAFLKYTFPSLVEAPIAYTRRCLYSDSRDGHFWIANHPEKNGLTVAAGGSGHGFKFAPILGTMIADAVESKPNPWLEKFRWRTIEEGTIGEEATRYHGQ